MQELMDRKEEQVSEHLKSVWRHGEIFKPLLLRGVEPLQPNSLEATWLANGTKRPCRPPNGSGLVPVRAQGPDSGQTSHNVVQNPETELRDFVARPLRSPTPLSPSSQDDSLAKQPRSYLGSRGQRPKTAPLEITLPGSAVIFPGTDTPGWVPEQSLRPGSVITRKRNQNGSSRIVRKPREGTQVHCMIALMPLFPAGTVFLDGESQYEETGRGSWPMELDPESG